MACAGACRGRKANLLEAWQTVYHAPGRRQASSKACQEVPGALRRMTTERSKIGLIGGGFMGKAHALAYAAMPMFFWPAPAHSGALRARRRKRRTRRRGGCAGSASNDGVSDWRRVIDNPEHRHRRHRHARTTATPRSPVAAAQAGKHVICEKPLARTRREARRMLRGGPEGAGVTHMVAFNYRHTPAVALAPQDHRARAASADPELPRHLPAGLVGRSESARCPGGSRRRSPDPARSATSARTSSTSRAIWSANWRR